MMSEFNDYRERFQSVGPDSGARHPYHPNSRKLVQLVISGFVATAVTVIVGYLFGMLGLPGMDYAAMYGAILNGGILPTSPQPVWWLGMIWHFIDGAIVFPIAYDFLIDRRAIPNRPWMKGVLSGALLWLLFEVLVKPLAGEGIFSTRMSAPAWMALFNLVQWLAYGIVLEAMTRVRIVHELRMGQKRAA